MLGEIGLSWFELGKQDFYVDCDIFKWLERVGENRIEIR